MNARLVVTLSAVAVFVALTACTPKRIPGTQINDTEDSRAILDVMEKYRTAVEGRDSETLVDLASKQFHDAGGTSNPDDDLAYENLAPALKDRFARIQNVNLILDIRSIDVDDGRAEAVYYYTLKYDMPGLANQRQSASDLKKMEFVRDGETWKIISGI